MTTLKTVEDLDVYRKARAFRCDVAVFCKTLPQQEAFRLKDQMLRASRSVTANIVDGFGRHHHQENSQFCRQARGSLVEMCDHLNCALDEGYLDESRYGALRKTFEDTLHVLNGYINYLQRCASNGVPRNEQPATSNSPSA